MVQPVAFLKSSFFKNVSQQGGAQAHAIKLCPKDHLVVSRQNDKNPKLWGYMNPVHYLSALEKNHNLFEIITTYPHKVYFDFDGPESTDFNALIQSLCAKVLTYFPQAILSLSGSNQGKSSIHIILQNYMILDDLHRTCVRQIALECGFDTAVYTKNRLMKCVNQSKSDGRIQAVLQGDDLKKHCITYFFTEALPFPILPEHTHEQVQLQQAQYFNLGSLPKINYTTTEDLHALEPKEILALLPCTTDYPHAYRHLVARFCHTHLDYATFLAWRLPTRDWAYKWSRLHLYPEVSVDRMKAILCCLYPKFRRDKNYSYFANSFDLPSEKIETISQATFQTNSVGIVLNTGMGSGKTAQTIDYLVGKEFIWITPNIALTNNTQKRFADQKVSEPAVHYKSISTADKKNGNMDKISRLLLSIHSLHYCNRTYEYVVLDEVETILMALQGKFIADMGHKAVIWTTLKRLLTSAKKVILLDAFTTTRTTNLLTQLGIAYTVFERMYEPTTRTVVHCENDMTMIDDMCTKLKQGSKILVFYPYKSLHNGLKHLLEETGKTVKYYNADIDDSVKLQLRDVNEHWNADCVILNNVVTCGVNYDKKDFDYQYLFVAPFSSPRDIAQVSYRARHLTSGIIYVAFIKGNPDTTQIDDCKTVQCPFYTQLYQSVLYEKFSPQKQSFRKFCIQARYKQVVSRHRVALEIEHEIDAKLQEHGIVYYYHDLTELDLQGADQIQEKVFQECATVYEKMQLHKYFFQLQFLEKNEDVARAWDGKLFTFIKQVGYMIIHEECIFRKIATFNQFDLFPKDITKVKLNEALLDQIFAEFRFKHLSRASSSKQILKEIYNTFFGLCLIKSSFNKATKNTSYLIHEMIEEFRSLYTKNLCTEAGTWIKVERPDSDEVEPDPEMI